MKANRINVLRSMPEALGEGGWVTATSITRRLRADRGIVRTILGELYDDGLVLRRSNRQGVPSEYRLTAHGLAKLRRHREVAEGTLSMADIARANRQGAQP